MAFYKKIIIIKILIIKILVIIIIIVMTRMQLCDADNITYNRRITF